MGDVERRVFPRPARREPEAIKPVPIEATKRSGKKVSRSHGKNSPARG
jgi:hypothetical protein